jgi:hypothetical protein
MSYRNPGQIYISNPNAFMEAFEKGIAPIKADLEKKAAERKERAKKYDAANAKLKQNLKYPEWVKKYGKQKADTIKTMIEEDYISNDRFASAAQSEQQDMLDEMNINISNIAQKTDAALQLDFDEILPGHFSENKEFLDFLASKPEENNDISLERIDGQIGFSYIKDGKKVFLDANNIPDGAINYQGKSATNESISNAISVASKEVDDKFTSAKTMTEATGYTKTKANSIYASLDDAQKEYLFEKMQIDIKGEEEGQTTYSYADVVADENMRKQLDDALKDYLVNEIEIESRQLTRLRSEEEVDRMKRAEEAREAQRKAAEEAEKAKQIPKKEMDRMEFEQFFNSDPIGAFIAVQGSTIDTDEETGQPMISYNSKTGRYDVVSGGEVKELTKNELFTSAYNEAKNVLDFTLQDYRERKQFVSSLTGPQQAQENNDFLD